jgi:hypothetical protein
MTSGKIRAAPGAKEDRGLMPIAYLDVPEGLQIEKKKEMFNGIYIALSEACPFPPDHRIFLREWPLESASQDGSLCWSIRWNW